MKVTILQGYSPDELILQVQKWLKEHGDSTYSMQYSNSKENYSVFILYK